MVGHQAEFSKRRRIGKKREREAKRFYNRDIYFAKYYGGGGGGMAAEKKKKLRVWGKNEKEGKRKKEKNSLKTHL